MERKKKNREEEKTPPFIAIRVGEFSLGGQVLRASPHVSGWF